MKNSTNINPGKGVINSFIRWGKINIGGYIMHFLANGGNPNIEQTSKGMIKLMNIIPEIDEDSLKAIKDFQELPNGLIIGNHPNGNFGDYIPLISQFDEDFLNGINFFAGKAIAPMLNNRFGKDKNFIKATFDSISEGKNLILNARKIAEEISKTGSGHILILPWGNEDSNIHKGFNGLFGFFLKNLPPETPILIYEVIYPDKLTYSKMYTRAIIGKIIGNSEELKPKLKARIMKVGDFVSRLSELNNGDSKQVYEEMIN